MIRIMIVSILFVPFIIEECKVTTKDNLKSASNLNGNLNCSKELEHYAS